MICPGCGTRDRYKSNEAVRGPGMHIGMRAHRCAVCCFTWYSIYDPAPAKPAPWKFPFAEHRTMAEIMAAEEAA